MGRLLARINPDIGLSELGIVMPFPWGIRARSAACRRLSEATQAQVGWLNADGPVAGVQNLLLAGRPR